MKVKKNTAQWMCRKAKTDNTMPAKAKNNFVVESFTCLTIQIGGARVWRVRPAPFAAYLV